MRPVFDLPQAQRRARTVEKHLRDLVRACLVHLDAMNNLMREPSTMERGRRVAAVCNQLEFAVDGARYHGLGIDFRKDPAAKKRETRQAKQSAATPILPSSRLR